MLFIKRMNQFKLIKKLFKLPVLCPNKLMNIGRGLHYNIRKDKSYFMTITVVDWIDLFTRVNHKQLLIDSLKFTSKALIDQIANEPESRREWLLERFKFAAKIHSNNKDFKVWRDKNHAIEIFSEKVTWQKLNYIHRNPVVDKIVYNEQDYLFSSARNYYGLPHVLNVDCLTPPVMTTSSHNFFNS